MKKLLNNPWVVGVLALVAIAFVANSLIPAGGGPAVVADEPVAEQPGDGQNSGVVAESGGMREALKELSISSATRDPFSRRAKTEVVKTQVVEKAAPPDLVETVKLTALWSQDGDTFALLNGRICRAGDKLGRLTLDKATQDGVWLTHWKGRSFVELGQVFTLTTPAHKAASLSLSTDS